MESRKSRISCSPVLLGHRLPVHPSFTSDSGSFKFVAESNSGCYSSK